MKSTHFIAIEGPNRDTTRELTNRLSKWIREDLKIKVEKVHTQGGGTKFATAVSALANNVRTDSKQAQLLATLTAQADIMDSVIFPCLNDGTHLLVDTWTLNSRIMHSFMANRPAGTVDKIIDSALSHPATKPTCYVVLQTSGEQIKKRIEDEIEAEYKEAVSGIKGKGSQSKKNKLREERDTQLAKIDNHVAYMSMLSSAYQRPMVFSDGVPCITANVDSKTDTEIFDEVSEILMAVVLSK